MVVDPNVASMLPLAIEDIDAPWLSAALGGAFPGIEVEDFDVVDVRHGFTTVARVRLAVNEAGRAAGVPGTVIVKGGFEPWSRERARTYAQEAIGYRDFWPAMPLNVPRAYFAEVDSTRKQAITIMEDLVPRGVVFGHGLTPLTYPQIVRSLSALAVFHAATWEHPDIGPNGRWDTTSSFEPDGRWSGLATNGALMLRDYMHRLGYFKPEVMARLATLPQGAAVARTYRDPEWARLALDYLAALHGVLPHCIVHGDTHLGNLYEEPDGTRGFFDGTPFREPFEREIAYHLACALDPADRRRWDRGLVAHYLSELARHGIQPPDFDQTMRNIAAYFGMGCYVFFINDTSWQTDAFNVANAARFSAACVDHDVKALIVNAAREPRMANLIAALPAPPPFEPLTALDWLYARTDAPGTVRV